MELERFLRDKHIPKPPGVRTALYRHFDEWGTLLYVGISLCAVQRLAQHRDAAPWYRWIARIDVEWLPSRQAAEQAERKAIDEEGPLFNVAHSNHTTRAAALARFVAETDAAEAQAAAMGSEHERLKARGEIGPDGFADAEAVINAAWRRGLIGHDGQQERLCA